MTDSFRTDLFSALHDGEIPHAESNAARAELNGSDAARQEMSDYNQLSGLMAELPVEQLGDEFRSQVMQAIERRMLIPAAGELMAGRRRSAARSWWPGLAGIAASAALLLAMVFFLDRRSDQQPNIAVRTAAEKTETARPSLERTSAVTTATAEAAKRPMKESKVAAHPSDGVPDAASVVAKDSNGDALPSITNRIEPPVQADFFGQNQRLEFNSSLEKAQVGDVVDALDRSGDRISVVRLTVVDRQQGLENLQVLLSKNSIPIEGDRVNEGEQLKSRLALKTEPAPQSKAAGIASEKLGVDKLVESGRTLGGNSEEEFVCVLVKADSELLSDALWQLREDGKFKTLNVEDPPIEVAELDKLVAGEEVAKNEEVDVPVVALKPRENSKLNIAKNDGLPHDEPLFAKRAMKKGDAKDAEGSVAQSAPSQQAVVDAKGRARSVREMPQQQTLVQLPSRMLARSVEAQPNSAPDLKRQQSSIVRNYQTQDGRRSQAQATRAKRAESAASQKANDGPAPSDPVQVLLVIVQGQAPTAAAAPPAAPAKHAE